MQFRLGSIPVRVRAPFLLLVLLLGASLQDENGHTDARALLAWAIIVFVSVLVHELGHALVGRAFGLQPAIELHGMGGATSWQDPKDVGHARRIAISLAGPFAGFVLGGLIFAAARYGLTEPTPMVAVIVRMALWVNVGWGILNLIPMLPLDGGNVMRSFLQIVTKGNGEKPARYVSIGVGGLGLLYALSTHGMWGAFLCGLFMYTNVQALRTGDSRVANVALGSAIQQAYAALDAHDGARAIALLRPALVPQASEELRQIGLRLFAYALMLEGEWAMLVPMLESERLLIGSGELERYAKTARELGRTDDASRLDQLIASMRPRMANDFGA
ncbi:hypothetical protein AKJ09_01816 [Labilithrix luteola]|uniref:Peptidase M50 domain-containing protein n=1 Tax=Labilithrix luteola TaxID=1391654 RepID=A0A0K1PNQ8_9BACT|nr:M50 family metallopeptidase [Labilithrix luteola]AKU95152.1 hypothetical protein AKJ09_01816 [Labilithrix luteola]